MKGMYKKGGKSSKKKESFMEESKEIHFGAPTKKYLNGGEMSPGKEARLTRKSERLSNKLKGINQGLKNAEAESSYEDNRSPGSDMVQPDTDYYMYQQSKKKARVEKRLGKVNEKLGKSKTGEKLYEAKTGGFPDLNKDGEVSFADVLEGRGVNKKMMGGKYGDGGSVSTMGSSFKNEMTKQKAKPAPDRGTGNIEPAKKNTESMSSGKQGMLSTKKTGGAKSMEPGGGGRFAKMVKGLKKEGKSEESAKAIAASVGRKKYGKSKFQAMANAGKKKMGGANC